jgi:hypothetical protein
VTEEPKKERKKTVYERVVASMHGIDDTIRDTIVYPDNRSVVGISESEDQLVLTYASKHDDGGHPQMIWINTEHLDALHAVQEAISRVLAYKAKAAEKAKAAKRQ